MATLTERAGKAVDRAAKSVQKQVAGSIDSVVKQTEKLRGEMERRAEETAEQTQKRGARLALSVVDFQKTTFDNVFKAVSGLQEKSENAISGVLHGSEWLPKEGKSVVNEWVRLLRTGRGDFQKTVQKSFDLITEYLERVESSAGKAPKKKAAKKAAAKKPAAKKPAAKKPAAKKAVAKKAPAKKKAAAK